MEYCGIIAISGDFLSLVFSRILYLAIIAAGLASLWEFI